VEVKRHGVPVDSRLCVAERLWAVGDITGSRHRVNVGARSVVLDLDESSD
jgi:hypothetical protein